MCPQFGSRFHFHLLYAIKNLNMYYTNYDYLQFAEMPHQGNEIIAQGNALGK